MPSSGAKGGSASGRSWRSSLRERRVGIVGLGLIGGSLGLALRPKVGRLLGVDPDPETRRLARRRQAAHSLHAHPKALARCDLVIVAAPQARIPAVCGEVAGYMKRGATLLEVGSVKSPIARRVSGIADHVNLVAGHPMAGTEQMGIRGARARLFRGRPFLLLPLRPVDPSALQLCGDVVRALGSIETSVAGAGEHDAAGAALIHLPHLLAYALCGLDAPKKLAGPSFMSATRVAHSSPRMVAEMLHANRQAILAALPDFEEQLTALIRDLGAPKRLQARLDRIREALEAD